MRNQLEVNTSTGSWRRPERNRIRCTESAVNQQSVVLLSSKQLYRVSVPRLYIVPLTGRLSGSKYAEPRARCNADINVRCIILSTVLRLVFWALRSYRTVRSCKSAQTSISASAKSRTPAQFRNDIVCLSSTRCSMRSRCLIACVDV